MTDSGKTLSIWFFVGILMLAYGIVPTATGTYEFSHPLPPTIILQQLHATFWWGLFLTAFGGFYSIRFRPGK